jgi:multiple sugar transport system substrate-binding protein
MPVVAVRVAIHDSESGGVRLDCGDRAVIDPRGTRQSSAVLAATLLLSACGHQTVDYAACHVVAPAHATRVNIISYPSPGMPFFGEQMAKCSSPPLLQIRHQMLPYEELASQSTISLSSHGVSRYHVIHVSDNLLVEWSSKGWLAPLDELLARYWTEYRLDEIPEAVWNAVRVNGHVYAVPALQNTENLYYRKDVLAKYGLDVPRTFDELEHTCRLLKEKGAAEYPLVMMYSKSSEHFSLNFHDLLHSMGGRWFNDDGTPAFNDKAGQAALTRMVVLYHACMHPDTVNFTPEDAIIGLQQGQFVIGVMWMNAEPQVDDASASKYAGRFGFAPAPAACSSCPPAGAWAIDSWVIPANSGVDRDLLFRIVMEGMKAANQVKASALTLVTRPAAARAAASPYWAPGLAAIDRGAMALPRKPYTYLAVNALERYGMEALLGRMSVNEALNRAAEQFSRSMHDEGFTK